MYLDFNGIIHNYAHFRMSEKQIFIAVDGEAKEIREKAESKGEELPDEKAFDSNYITPDTNWRGVQAVLSGHEAPGEEPDYNPNVRHCLYGPDADLIMLSPLSHDPHFCLLREQVKFGPAAKRKGNVSLENLDFYLLHLSLMREYLDLEFRDIEDRVIDDFILLAVFVGNDFLPNLPDLHIHENGPERLFDAYKKGGVINTKRLQVVLNETTIWEREIFEKEYADSNWFKGKRSKRFLHAFNETFSIKYSSLSCKIVRVPNCSTG
ncbi:hypothetical protein DFJ58DRAFT_719318 [Suillus subalutaceus]|uniref:uncharacterized protein n=1 Tax=Suillus subalutaceus TaxID=48586 RepID=UPI001B87392D|nr:uncharacterized protein DFJ58DRAFT_719318 [Suillus subalutaceus]KAG1834950.1 hypothetical protein DFJ58DRAFT_719318 [Suillus subalutaceus]